MSVSNSSAEKLSLVYYLNTIYRVTSTSSKSPEKTNVLHAFLERFLLFTADSPVSLQHLKRIKEILISLRISSLNVKPGAHRTRQRTEYNIVYMHNSYVYRRDISIRGHQLLFYTLKELRNYSILYRKGRPT